MTTKIWAAGAALTLAALALPYGAAGAPRQDWRDRQRTFAGDRRDPGRRRRWSAPTPPA